MPGRDAARRARIEAFTTMIISSPETQTGLMRRSMMTASRLLRIPLLVSCVLGALGATLAIVGTLQSEFDQCCVPFGCSHVDALHGSFPGFSRPYSVCLLTPSDAAALQCAMPNATSQALNTLRQCHELSSECLSTSSAFGYLVAAGSIMAAASAFMLLLPVHVLDNFGISRLLSVMLWGTGLIISLIGVTCVAIGTSTVWRMNGELVLSTAADSVTQAPLMFNEYCFNGTSAVALQRDRASTTLQRATYLASVACGVATLCGVFLPMILRRFNASHRQELEAAVRERLVRMMNEEEGGAPDPESSTSEGDDSDADRDAARPLVQRVGR